MTELFSRPANRTISTVIVICLVALQVVGLTPQSWSAAAADDLKQIQYRYYFRGKYVQAIEALRTFLARTDLNQPEVVAAREFLAASYVLSGASDLGRDLFLKMLSDDSQYSGPDPAVFKPAVVGVYNTARDEFAAALLRTPPQVEPAAAGPETPGSEPSKPIYKKWWFYAGLVAVVVVVGAAASGKGEEEEEKVSPPTGTVSIGVQVR